MLVTAATLPLALALGCDIYVVIGKIFASSSVGAGVVVSLGASFRAHAGHDGARRDRCPFLPLERWLTSAEVN
jgi:hypothetical protein